MRQSLGFWHSILRFFVSAFACSFVSISSILALPNACKILLDNAARMLTQEAIVGSLPKTFGNSNLPDKIVQSIQQSVRPHVLLVGNGGVGKTSLVNEAVRRMPDSTEVIELNLAALRSSSGVLGSFEKTLRSSLEESEKKARESGVRNVVLFFPRLSDLTDAGPAAGAQRPAFEIIESFIEDQKRKSSPINFSVITEANSEQSGLLKGRQKDFFNQIEVSPPSKDESVLIVREIANQKEKEWGLSVDQSAVIRAVELADQSTRPLSVIELLDRAAILKRSRSELSPLTQSSRAEGEKARNADRRLSTIEGELAKLRSEIAAIESLRVNGELGRAQAMKLTSLRAEEKKLDAETNELRPLAEIYRKSAPILTEDDVNEAWKANRDAAQARFEEMTSDQAYWDRLRSGNAEAWFSERLKGQPEAVKVAVKMVKTLALRGRDASRPLYNALFVGPSTVGKTYLAELISEFIFGEGSDSVITINGEEYQEKHSVSRMIGSPPGYMGSDEGGQLTNRLLKIKRGVVVLDEIEKMHPDVRKVLFTALRHGYINDARGVRIPTNNIIFVATSNAGMEMIEEALQQNPNNPEIITSPAFVQRLEREALIAQHGFDRPFLNRMDAVVPFRALSPEVLQDIGGREFKKLQKRVASGERVKIEASDNVLKLVSSFRYRPELGAKNVKDNFRMLIETPVLYELLFRSPTRGEFEDGKATIKELIVDNQIVGLEYELFKSDSKTSLGRLQLLPSKTSPGSFDLIDPNQPDQIIESFSNELPPSKSDPKVEGEAGSGNSGAAATPQRDSIPEPAALPNMQEARASVRQMVGECVYCRTHEISDSAIDFLARFRFQGQEDAQRIRQNVDGLIQDPLNMISTVAPAAQRRMVVSHQGATQVFPQGALKFDLYGDRGEVLETFYYEIQYQQAGHKYSFYLKHPDGRPVRLPTDSANLRPHFPASAPQTQPQAPQQ